ncbi:Cytochrome c [Candidatus Hodgkinia cicadicola]|uniref:Cytochrome c n=1 Tax=Candidatus Hodgkinia cicadicola TaxID=573658 RepID=A0ABX4MFD4_9HYPH|nr:Cytochrome c [Candidatus Hodgkinia cicadicola]
MDKSRYNTFKCMTRLFDVIYDNNQMIKGHCLKSLTLLVNKIKQQIVDILNGIKPLCSVDLLSKFMVHPTNLSLVKSHQIMIRKQTDIRPFKSKTNKRPRALNTLLLCSTLNNGERYFNVCSGCHSIEEGKPHKFGPNLWNVVFRSVACCSNYTYSSALIKLSNFKWTFNSLNKFIECPKDFIDGTYMDFLGIKDQVGRMGVLRYLNYNSSKPLSFNRFKFN